MNEENKPRQVILISLASLFIGSMLLAFGLSVGLIIALTNYLIAMILYLCSLLATYRNNQESPNHMYKYLMILSAFFIVFASIIMIIHYL